MDELPVTGRAAGGVARAQRLTAEQRSEIAKKAAGVRWAGDHEVREVLAGSPDKPLRIGDVEIECYVLDDDTRVITQASMLQALGRHRRAAGADDVDLQLPPILQGKAIRPFIPADVVDTARPVSFKLPNGGRANGYRAELLPVFCEVYLAARAAGALPPNQRRVAAQAEILIRGLAHVGIIALVDEATGYQDIRTKDALARILDAFIEKELQPWARTFPPDFYKQMFRLRGVVYDPSSVKRPQYFGTLTNDVVYARLAPGVLSELKKVKQKPGHRLFQHLTANTGYPKLREHLGSIVTLMKLSTDWNDFKLKLEMFHPRYDINGGANLWSDSDVGL
jgi:hypothetical protein